MDVYCYANDLSLLSPSFTGLQEMLRLCELYAIDHNIIFNAKESQLLYYGSNPSNDPCTVDLTMLNGQFINNNNNNNIYLKSNIHKSSIDYKYIHMYNKIMLYT